MNQQTTRTIGNGVSLLIFSDYFINVDLSNGAATIVLPKVSDVMNYLQNSSGTYVQNQSYRFKDIKNLAATNNITVIAANGDKISGASSQIFNTNGISFSLQITSDTDWDISSSSTGTGGVVGIDYGSFTRFAIQGSGVQTVPTLKKAKLIFFNALIPKVDAYSEGKSNLVLNNLIGSNPSGFVGGHQSYCIILVNGGDGFFASVTAINDTSFDITWIVIGGGVDASVQWHSITG